MTPTNRDELIEVGAEAMWQDESMRARGRPRNIPWSEAAEIPRAVWRGLFAAGLTAIEASGCAVVTIEATEEMKTAGEGAIDDAFTACLSPTDTWETETVRCYTAMLSAAPFNRSR